uniref:Uncharacterized protein n=1 Tax=Anguilla anguilla TaxID=7936 RepID=A0A0E9XWY5_ANGAN
MSLHKCFPVSQLMVLHLYYSPFQCYEKLPNMYAPQDTSNCILN